LHNVGGILSSKHQNGFSEVPIIDLLNELLYPYTAPVITSFKLNPAAGVKEKNVEFDVSTAQVNVVKKSQ
jgi:hypothetical protein